MVRENSSIHGGKMNVIFADGHAQGMWPYEVENLMDADKAEDHTGE
jgi:prepilin-type processing-associated H-X9-DG protein